MKHQTENPLITVTQVSLELDLGLQRQCWILL